MLKGCLIFYQLSVGTITYNTIALKYLFKECVICEVLNWNHVVIFSQQYISYLHNEAIVINIMIIIIDSFQEFSSQIKIKLQLTDRLQIVTVSI